MQKNWETEWNKLDLKETYYGCDGAEVCCGTCGGEYLSETKVQDFIRTNFIPKAEVVEKIEALRLPPQKDEWGTAVKPWEQWNDNLDAILANLELK